MKFEIEVRENGKVLKNADKAAKAVPYLTARLTEEIPKEALNAVNDVLLENGFEMRNHIITEMRDTPKAPWSYPRTRSGKVHHPSMPYNFPAIDFGWLVEHILVDNGDGWIEIGAEIQDPPYPFFLEEGTVKMEPRPWLRPTVDQFASKIENDVAKTIKEVIGKK